MHESFTKPIHCAGLVGKLQSAEVAESMPILAGFLHARGIRVLIEQAWATGSGLGDYPVGDYDELGRAADVVIALGGDGTLLAATRRLAVHGVPMIGVNQGRLGFMTDIARTDMLARIQELLDGRFTGETRILLEAEVIRASRRVFHSLAFNDVVINKGDLGRMIEFQVEVDGENLYVLRADGLIVATPTGSTAYALSANGPILHPGVTGIALVPLCPHALSNRPITIGDDSRVGMKLMSPHDGRIHCDGQAHFDLRTGDRIEVRRSPHRATLLHPPGYSYFAMLREKLRWSETPGPAD